MGIFSLIKAQYTLPEFRPTEAPEMPKGIFSYQKSETSIKNEMHVPNSDFSHPIDMASELINTAVAKATHRNEGFSGVNIPLPFGLSPLNLQLSQDSETQFGVSHEEDNSTTVSPTSSINQRRAPDLNSRMRSALENARQICIEQTQNLCDRALEKYHRFRFGGSLAEDRKRLRKAQPQNWATYVQTGLAKWLVPSLDQHLNKIVLNETSKTPNVVALPSTIERPHTTTKKQKLKRQKTLLPARRIVLPPRR